LDRRVAQPLVFTEAPLSGSQATLLQAIVACDVKKESGSAVPSTVDIEAIMNRNQTALNPTQLQQIKRMPEYEKGTPIE
jgi:hypothetical protein